MNHKRSPPYILGYRVLMCEGISFEGVNYA